MTINVLFIHSAGSQSGQQGSSPFVKHLCAELGPAFNVNSPKMPAPTRPSYERWKNELEKQLGNEKSPKILIGHSLGGSVLLKYLSEQKSAFQAIALFIVAAPYWGAKDWMVEEFILRKNFSQFLPVNLKIYLYQSRDDEVLPMEHLSYYSKAIPQAKVRKLKVGGHIFKNGCAELVQDIQKLPNALVDV